MRVGVGEKPPRMDLADYVLGHFSQGERKIMEDAVKEAATRSWRQWRKGSAMP